MMVPAWTKKKVYLPAWLWMPSFYIRQGNADTYRADTHMTKF